MAIVYRQKSQLKQIRSSSQSYRINHEVFVISWLLRRWAVLSAQLISRNLFRKTKANFLCYRAEKRNATLGPSQLWYIVLFKWLSALYQSRYTLKVQSFAGRNFRERRQSKLSFAGINFREWLGWQISRV